MQKKKTKKEDINDEYQGETLKHISDWILKYVLYQRNYNESLKTFISKNMKIVCFWEPGAINKDPYQFK